MKIENNEIRIEIPEGMEIDKENSTFEYIKFKPKKLTYVDIAKALFENKQVYRLTSNNVYEIPMCSSINIMNTNCVTRKQAHKLIALNKLINVAKYLNEDWEPDFEDNTYKKYYIKHDIQMNVLIIDSCYNTTYGTTCFKTKELAEQAIEILGEETIKLALS